MTYSYTRVIRGCHSLCMAIHYCLVSGNSDSRRSRNAENLIQMFFNDLTVPLKKSTYRRTHAELATEN